MSRSKARAIDRMIRRVGDGRTAEVLRRNGLFATGGAPALELAAEAALEATSIRLTATGLKGSLRSGFVVSIAGDAQAYTTTAAADVAAGEITLPITPAIAKVSALGTSVSIPPTVSATFRRLRDQSARRRTDGVEIDRAMIHLSSLEPGVLTPEPGDLYRESGREDERIADVLELAPGARRLVATVIIGEAA